jgi:hypothetical protein
VGRRPTVIGQEDWDREERIFERGRASALASLPHGEVLELVRAELDRALARFPAFNSPHEAKAVIEEELDELWEQVKANRGRGPAAMTEAVQVAAMACRYVLDLSVREES